MSHETLDRYLSSIPGFGPRVLPSSDSSDFWIRDVSEPDVFQTLRYSIFRYYEEQGYLCAHEQPLFSPSRRTLFFRNSQRDLAFSIKLDYRLDEGSRDRGRVHITREDVKS